MRWPIALLVAVLAHGLVIVTWLGVGASTGAKFGSEGIHVGLSILSQFDAISPEEVRVDPLEELHAEFELSEGLVEPHTLIEPIPLELPTPEMPSFPLETSSLGLPTLDIPLAVLDLKPPSPSQPSNKQGSGPGHSDQEGSSKRLSNAYMVRVSAHLNRFKRYPKTSRRAREEGNADVEFTIYAEGNVDSIKLVKSSGFGELDEEAIRMVRRAAPFPKIPRALRIRGIDKLQIRSTIKFSIRE